MSAFVIVSVSLSTLWKKAHLISSTRIQHALILLLHDDEFLEASVFSKTKRFVFFTSSSSSPVFGRFSRPFDASAVSSYEMVRFTSRICCIFSAIKLLCSSFRPTSSRFRFSAAAATREARSGC